jgi:hypothetical protein
MPPRLRGCPQERDVKALVAYMQLSVREASACALALRRAPLPRAERWPAQVKERRRFTVSLARYPGTVCLPVMSAKLPGARSLRGCCAFPDTGQHSHTKLQERAPATACVQRSLAHLWKVYRRALLLCLRLRVCAADAQAPAAWPPGLERPQAFTAPRRRPAPVCACNQAPRPRARSRSMHMLVSLCAARCRTAACHVALHTCDVQSTLALKRGRSAQAPSS